MIEKLKDKDYVLSHLETRIMSRKSVMNSTHNYVYISISNQDTIFDWLVTFAIRLSDDSCVIVTTDLVSHEMPWLSCPGDLWDYWLRSEQHLVCEPVDSLLGIETQSESASSLWVVTTSTHELGGAAFLHPSMQTRLHNLFPDGFFLVLSSRHESLVCPKDIATPKGIFDIFTEINNNPDITPVCDKVTDDLLFCDKPFHMGKVVI